MKIRTKLTIVMTFLTLLTVLSISFFVGPRFDKVMIGYAEKTSVELTNAEQANISEAVSDEAAFSSYLTKTQAVMDLLSNPKDMAKQDIVNKMLMQYADGKTNMEHIFLADNKGIIIADSIPKNIGLDLSKRKYTIDTLETGKQQISDVLTSKATGKQVVVFTNPVIDKSTGEVKGFIANPILAESMVKYLKNAKLGGAKSSYAYLVDTKGDIIYHPTAAKIGKPVENAQAKELIKRIQNGEKLKPGIISYVYKGVSKIAAYAEVPQTNWLLVITCDAGEIQAPAKDMKNYITLIGILIILLSSGVGIITARQISEPIKKLIEVVNKTARLDLTYDDSIETLSRRKDEVGSITMAMEGMRKALGEMVQALKLSSTNIMDNANLVESVVEKVQENSASNSATAEEISAGIEETAASAQEMSASIAEVGHSIETVADKTKMGTDLSLEIADRAALFKESTIASKKEAESIYSDVKVKLESATEESKEVSQINDLIDAIMQITNQTNLLALNAAIEAARAGEAGKGFSVVAEEVRKLAVQSSETAADIQKIVGTVYNAVENMKLGSEKVLAFIENNVRRDYGEAINICNQYDNDALMIKDIMKTINESTQELTSTMSAISTAVNEVAVTVTEGAQGVNHMAEKTSDIVTLIEDVEKTAEESVNQAKALNEMVKKFNL